MSGMRRRVHILALATLVLAACGSGGRAAGTEPSATIGDIGALPRYGTAPEPDAAPPASTSTSTSASNDMDTTAGTTDPTVSTESSDPPDRSATTDVAATTDVTVEATRPTVVRDRIGAPADGNRVLMIGDSIMAAASVGNGGAMCADLVARGWQVGMDAVGSATPTPASPSRNCGWRSRGTPPSSASAATTRTTPPPLPPR